MYGRVQQRVGTHTGSPVGVSTTDTSWTIATATCPKSSCRPLKLQQASAE